MYVRYIKVHAFGESLLKEIWKFCTIWMYKHKFPNDYCQLSMKLLATQCYLYLKAHPQGIVEMQSFVTDLTFFLLCRGIDGTKYEMSEWLSFPLWVQGHELVSWVQPICLSVCLSVWSVYFCLCTQMAGLAIWVHTFSFCCVQTGHWVPGLVISSAILCVCLSIYVSTKLQEAKLLHFWFQVCKLSEILQLSSYIFDNEYVCLDG